MNFRKFLRQPNSINVFWGLLVVGAILLLAKINVLGFVLLFFALVVVFLIYSEEQSTFLFSQAEWWDDEEWQAWERGEKISNISQMSMTKTQTTKVNE